MKEEKIDMLCALKAKRKDVIVLILMMNTYKVVVDFIMDKKTKMNIRKYR